MSGVEMQFPLSYWDLFIWLAVNAIILLIVSELLSSHSGSFFSINKGKLRMIALTLGVLFIIAVVVETYYMLMMLPD